MKIDQRVINGLNKNNILELIRLYAPISRAELSRRTHLSLPAVMKITDGLIARGIVTDETVGKSTGGKPPRLLEFNYRAGYIIGVDIDYHRVDTILMDLSANVVEECSHDIHASMAKDDIRDTLVETLRTLLHKAEDNNRLDYILGIGVSADGNTDFFPAFARDPRLYVEIQGEIAAFLEETFHYPVYLEKSIYAKAMGEKMVGDARDTRNFLFVNFGQKIESALIFEKRIFRGDLGKAGAIGHVMVKRDGKKCDCGKRGCLNTIAGQKAIGDRGREAVSALKEGQYSMLLDMVYGHKEQVDFYTVIEAAENSDRQAVEIMTETVQAVGDTLINLATLLDVRTIIVSGKLVDCSRRFVRALRNYFKENQPVSEGAPVVIRTSRLGRHIGAIGAASSVLNRFLKDEIEEE